MNWPDGSKGRVLAATYLTAFAASATGLAWTLYNQLSGAGGIGVVAGAVLFVGGQIVTMALALTAQRSGGTTFNSTWQRLASGLELASAQRVLRRNS